MVQGCRPKHRPALITAAMLAGGVAHDNQAYNQPSTPKTADSVVFERLARARKSSDTPIDNAQSVHPTPGVGVNDQPTLAIDQFIVELTGMDVAPYAVQHLHYICVRISACDASGAARRTMENDYHPQHIFNDVLSLFPRECWSVMFAADARCQGFAGAGATLNWKRPSLLLLFG